MKSWPQIKLLKPSDIWTLSDILELLMEKVLSWNMHGESVLVAVYSLRQIMKDESVILTYNTLWIFWITMALTHNTVIELWFS